MAVWGRKHFSVLQKTTSNRKPSGGTDRYPMPRAPQAPAQRGRACTHAAGVQHGQREQQERREDDEQQVPGSQEALEQTHPSGSERRPRAWLPLALLSAQSVQGAFLDLGLQESSPVLGAEERSYSPGLHRRLGSSSPVLAGIGEHRFMPSKRKRGRVTDGDIVGSLCLVSKSGTSFWAQQEPLHQAAAARPGRSHLKALKIKNTQSMLCRPSFSSL